MSEISEAAKAKANDLIRAANPDGRLYSAGCDSCRALARFIQQVSDAAKLNGDPDFAPFVLPEPVDPLAECIREAVRDCGGQYTGSGYDVALRRAFAKRGLKIVEASNG